MSDVKDAPAENPRAVAGSNANAQLRSVVDRIEKLEEEKKAVAEDIRGVYVEAKGNGYDPKVLRILVRERGMDKSEREERDELLDVYRHALGMV